MKNYNFTSYLKNWLNIVFSKKFYTKNSDEKKIPLNISRRIFIFLSLSAIFYLIGKIWYDAIIKHKSLLKFAGAKKIIPLNQKEEILFQDEIIITNIKGKTQVFSGRCPHLGCIINKVENGQLVCPCHGSRFSLEGIVIAGPAAKNLTSLTFKIIPEKRILEIEPD